MSKPSFLGQVRRARAAGIALLCADAYYPDPATGLTVRRRLILSVPCDGALVDLEPGQALTLAAEIDAGAAPGPAAAAHLDDLGVPELPAQGDAFAAARERAKASRAQQAPQGRPEGG